MLCRFTALVEAGGLDIHLARQDVVREGFTIESAGRIVRPNTRPGLGIEINEAEVKKHPFEQEILQRVNHPDGSVGDW